MQYISYTTYTTPIATEIVGRLVPVAYLKSRKVALHMDFYNAILREVQV